MTNFKLVAIGTSVVWGQGLRHGDKFTTLFYRSLTGQEWSETNMVARSGAIVGVGVAGSPISPTLVPDQQARNEVPFDFPTILHQVDDAVGAEDADIVILDGGINDVLSKVLSNTDTEDVLDAPIRAACHGRLHRGCHQNKGRDLGRDRRLGLSSGGDRMALAPQRRHS